jgi:hypothetical protein
MKSTNASRSRSGYSTKNSCLYFACAIALSALIALPAFAQRGEGNREQRSDNKRNEVRTERQQANRPESRGNAPTQMNAPRTNTPREANAPRGNVDRRDVRAGNDRLNAPRQGAAQIRDNRRDARNDHFYGRWPARGASVRVLPQGGYWRNHNGIRYMYHNGFYYRPYGSSYVVVAPPFGFRITTLPVGFVAFTLANAAYYYYAGAYYQRYNNEYVVVQPPLGALVQSIPEGGQQVVIDGNTFYIVDGVQYQAVMFHGSIWYKVIKIEDRVDDYNGENPY